MRRLLKVYLRTQPQAHKTHTAVVMAAAGCGRRPLLSTPPSVHTKEPENVGSSSGFPGLHCCHTKGLFIAANGADESQQLPESPNNRGRCGWRGNRTSLLTWGEEEVYKWPATRQVVYGLNSARHPIVSIWSLSQGNRRIAKACNSWEQCRKWVCRGDGFPGQSTFQLSAVPLN